MTTLNVLVFIIQIVTVDYTKKNKQLTTVIDEHKQTNIHTDFVHYIYLFFYNI